jgi:hypothetical protein
MSDAAEIQQILNLYSDGASRRDFDRVIATFVEDSFWEVGRYSDRDELFDCVGTYFDSLVRTAGGWRFIHRRFVTHGISSWPVLPGVASAIEPG